MTTELVVIRHGETEFNRRGLYQGHADSPLTPLGEAQALRLAPRLRSLDCTATVHCSDLGRARRTAELLVQAPAHRVCEDVALRERCYGVFEGLSRTEIAAQYPDARIASGAANPDYTPPGAETQDEFNGRVIGAFDRIANEHAGERVIVVTHGGVVTAFARYVLGVPADAPRRFDIGNTSLSLLYREDVRGWMVRFLGDMSHLEGDAAGG
ncbi:MAG: histidine phosphatase family protein [Gammaproteobacteria bacterium]|nr:histidine phosphatase family protein [Gammaproteobacteria bacterium]